MSISLTATTSAAVDAAIRYKILGFGTYVSGKTTLLISSKEMEYIMKIVKSVCDSGLLVKYFTKQLKMKLINK